MSACGTTVDDCGAGSHLCIPQGGTKNVTFYYREQDGTPIDITGLEARVRLAIYDATTNLFTFTSDPAAGLVITDAAAGRIDWTITPTQSATLDVGVKLEWQLDIYDPGDATIIKRFPTGTADVTDSVP